MSLSYALPFYVTSPVFRCAVVETNRTQFLNKQTKFDCITTAHRRNDEIIEL